MERIEQLAYQLRKYHNIHKVGDHLKIMLVQNGIISKPSYVHVKLLHANNPNFISLAAIVEGKHNVFAKDIIIMIKPEHSDKRCLRVGIQVGKMLFENLEDIDNPKWTNKRVFIQELRKAEKDVRAVFKKLKAA